MSTPPEKPSFLLLLHQPYDAAQKPGPEEMARIMTRFQAWMEDIRRQATVVSTNGLDYTGKVLRGQRGERVHDGPYVEAKEVIGGYVLITANDFDHAMAIARECPGLDYAMAVEVRPVIPR